MLQCYLESSNVNVVNELVTMIQTQRAYEMNSKAISTSDQMLGRFGTDLIIDSCLRFIGVVFRCFMLKNSCI